MNSSPVSPNSPTQENTLLGKIRNITGLVSEHILILTQLARLESKQAVIRLSQKIFFLVLSFIFFGTCFFAFNILIYHLLLNHFSPLQSLIIITGGNFTLGVITLLIGLFIKICPIWSETFSELETDLSCLKNQKS